MWPTAPTQWLAFEFAIEMPDAWVGDSEPKEQNQFSHRSMANLANVKVLLGPREGAELRKSTHSCSRREGDMRAACGRRQFHNVEWKS